MTRRIGIWRPHRAPENCPLGDAGAASSDGPGSGPTWDSRTTSARVRPQRSCQFVSSARKIRAGSACRSFLQVAFPEAGVGGLARRWKRLLGCRDPQLRSGRPSSRPRSPRMAWWVALRGQRSRSLTLLRSRCEATFVARECSGTTERARVPANSRMPFRNYQTPRSDARSVDDATCF